MAKFLIRSEIEVEAGDIIRANERAVEVLDKANEGIDVEVINYGVMPKSEVKK